MQCQQHLRVLDSLAEKSRGSVQEEKDFVKSDTVKEEDNDIEIGDIDLSDVDGVLKFNVRVFHRRVS